MKRRLEADMSTAAQRLRSVVDQVVPGVNDTPSRVFSKDPDDVVKLTAATWPQLAC